MAIIQSKYYKGNARTAVPHPHRKAEVLEYVFTHVFDEDLDTSDILDLFPIFPYGKIVGFDHVLVGNGTTAKIDIGLMTGSPGSFDSARTSDDVLAAAKVVATPAVATLAEIVAIPANGETATSIGVKTDVKIVAGAAKMLHVRIRISS